MHRVLIPAALLLLALAARADDSDSRDLFERARLLDEANQNVKEAIKLYGEFVDHAEGDRALAARAEYRIGILYERLGRTADAQRTYKLIVTRYADQTDIVQRARAKIIDLHETPSIIEKTGPAPDGSYIETFTFSMNTSAVAAVDRQRHRLYVATTNYHSNPTQAGHAIFDPSTLVVIDTENDSILKTINLGEYVAGIAFNPRNNRIYVAAQQEKRVDAINATTFVRTSIPVSGLPTDVVVNPVTNRIYVSCQGFGGNDKVFMIHGDDDSVSEPHDLNGVAGKLQMNTATNRLYVTSSPKTRVFNGADLSVVTDLPGIEVQAVDSVGNRLFVRTADPVMQVLDGNTHVVLASINLPVRDTTMTYDQDRQRLYAMLPARDQLSVIDTTRYAELGRFQLPEGPRVAAIDPGTGHAYVFHVGIGTKQAIVGVFHAKDVERDTPEEFADAAWTVVPGWGRVTVDEAKDRVRLQIGERGKAKQLAMLIRRFRGDRWTLELKSSFFSGSSGGSRNLWFAVRFGVGPSAGTIPVSQLETTTNSVAITRARDDWNGCCSGDIREDIVENGRSVNDNALRPNSDESYVWRITRDGRKVTVERSDDGAAFAVIDTHTFGPQIDDVTQAVVIGFTAFADTDAYADYERVRLLKNR